ncbi:MAG: class I SAM-dependent methyltransferase, partial [Oscillospiraceae bacterium]|nr:class I SAM-dependent methyltransferase [Oscillospiraceae bacterium]
MDSFDIESVIEYFNSRAAAWDEKMVRNEEAISAILDVAGIRAGIDVLDVACGTGVLFPDYFSRGVSSLTAIDVAPKMARRAQEKFPQADVICGNVET